MRKILFRAFIYVLLGVIFFGTVYLMGMSYRGE